MKKYEVIVVGAGPAGLSAAIYTARAGMSTLILGCEPKISGDYDIDNYFGFPETITGKELLERGKRQAKRFGVEMRCDRVLGIHPTAEEDFEIKTETGSVKACSIILSTGVSRIRPGIEDLSGYEGKGVSYCVSCDGFFFRNKQVMVVGEGIFAANQALELTQYTPHVSICSQGKPLSMTEPFKEKLKEAGIPIKERKIQRVEGEDVLERVVYDDGSEEAVDGLFIALGEASSLDFAYSLGLMRNGVFLQADEEQKTNFPGVFAAGDCVGRFLQISVAVGEGAIAGRSAISFVKQQCRAKQQS
ncbi:MAG: NAD(P)/FAD-dependent oxidoreductase [Thermodesulfobacteriota bacterium]